MQDFVKQLAKTHKLDPRVVKHIVDHPMRFVRDRMKEVGDNRPIRIMHLGVFDLKHPTLKERDMLKCINWIIEKSEQLSEILNIPANDIITEAESLLLSKQYIEFVALYKKYRLVIKKLSRNQKL